MKYILVNYNHDPTEILKYTDDFLIMDRSDDGKDWCKDLPKDKVIKTENIGHCDYDKLMYLVNFYDALPDVFLWGKTNLIPRHITKEEFESIKDPKEFVPLLTQKHKTYSDKYGEVCYYKDGMYYERNDNWYLYDYPAKNFGSYNDFARYFGLDTPQYIPFAPGGNYILTRDIIHKYSRDFYAEMASFLPYCRLPGEAQFCERSYFNMWK